MVLCKMLHLLVRDVSGNVTCMLSIRKEVGSDFSLNICITFWKTTQLDSIQQFQQFFPVFKVNFIIIRLFENFFVPLPPIRYFSYQEMRRFAQRHSFPFILYSIALSTFRLAPSKTMLSNYIRYFSITSSNDEGAVGVIS